MFDSSPKIFRFVVFVLHAFSLHGVQGEPGILRAPDMYVLLFKPLNILILNLKNTWSYNWHFGLTLLIYEGLDQA